VYREKAQALLKQSGLRRTPGRIALLNAILQAKNPLSFQEIQHRVSGAGLNRVSVYRGLHAFVEAHLIHRIETGDRLWRFAAAVKENVKENRPQEHPHFTCRNCGIVECFPSMKMPEIREIRPGYTIERKEFNLQGICANCSKAIRCKPNK